MKTILNPSQNRPGRLSWQPWSSRRTVPRALFCPACFDSANDHSMADRRFMRPDSHRRSTPRPTCTHVGTRFIIFVSAIRIISVSQWSFFFGMVNGNYVVTIEVISTQCGSFNNSWDKFMGHALESCFCIFLMYYFYILLSWLFGVVVMPPFCKSSWLVHIKCKYIFAFFSALTVFVVCN